MEHPPQGYLQTSYPFQASLKSLGTHQNQRTTKHVKSSRVGLNMSESDYEIQVTVSDLDTHVLTR